MSDGKPKHHRGAIGLVFVVIAGCHHQGVKYPEPREAAFEANNPHCVGHSHLSHCFFLLGQRGWGPAAPPPYEQWPSTLHSPPLPCAEASHSDCPTRAIGSWLALPQNRMVRVSNRVRERVPGRYAEFGASEALVTEVSGVPEIETLVEPNVVADSVKLWARAEKGGTLIERFLFLGE